jgi:von Willebrand factor A domain-containing protein 7
MRILMTSARFKRLALIGAWMVLLAPAISGFKSNHHENITREVLGEVTRVIDGHTLKFQPQAVKEIVKANVDQDEGAVRCGFGFSPGGPFADSANHFDSEDLNNASSRARTRFDDAVKALMRPSPDGGSARRMLGQVLHGAQDYYAHSNWVETQSGTDSRLSVSTFSAVGREVQTCELPPNTGTYVSFVGLTSGYWFGCTGKDDSQLPTGKCYHGLVGFGENYAGTNKDDADRPNFTEARQSAKDTTRAIINRILDSNGIAGNLNRTAALMGYKTLAFAVDTTGSMSEELPAVKASVQDTVSAAVASGDTPGFVLVRFGDDVAEPFITSDANAFMSAVDALTAGGGGDCPENSGAATLRAVRASVQGSTVFTYTDASAKDPGTAVDAKLRAEANDIQLQVRASGSCSPVDPVYKDMTSETGGQLFFVSPSELPALTGLTTPQVSGDFQPLLIAGGAFTGAPRVFTVAVDPSVRRVIFAVASEAAVTITVTRPDGTPVMAGNPGVTVQNLSTASLVGVEMPPAGTWTLTTNGTGEFSASIAGNTPLFLDNFKFVDYVDLKHPGFYEIQGQPLSGQPVTARGRVDGTFASITFEAVSREGASLGTLALATGHPDAADGDYTGTFTPPSEPFRVIARGTDGGFAFQRIVPTLFRPQLVRVFKDEVPDSILPGTQAVATFFVQNTGPDATFDIVAHDDRGFVTGVSPQTLSLAQNAIGSVQVTLLAPFNPVTGSPSSKTQLRLSALFHGQTALGNSAIVDIDAQSVAPAAAEATYYLHAENSNVTFGAFVLKTTSADAPTLVRTSGNMKGRQPQTGAFGWWDTDAGVPGYEGVIPSGATVTVTLWMKKTTNWGTVFPYATMKLNDAWGAFFCAATGTTPVTTTLAPYTFSCTTTNPIPMYVSDRLIVFPGYSMTAGPGNHNMEIQMQLEGTTDSIFVMPNPR